MSPKLPRQVREADTFEKKPQPVPMWTNKAMTQVRLWPTGGTAQVSVNTPVLRGQVYQKDFGAVAFCTFNPPLRGLFTAGYIKLDDLSLAPIEVTALAAE